MFSAASGCPWATRSRARWMRWRMSLVSCCRSTFSSSAASSRVAWASRGVSGPPAPRGPVRRASGGRHGLFRRGGGRVRVGRGGRLGRGAGSVAGASASGVRRPVPAGRAAGSVAARAPAPHRPWARAGGPGARRGRRRPGGSRHDSPRRCSGRVAGPCGRRSVPGRSRPGRGPVGRVRKAAATAAEARPLGPRRRKAAGCPAPETLRLCTVARFGTCSHLSKEGKTGSRTGSSASRYSIPAIHSKGRDFPPQANRTPGEEGDQAEAAVGIDASAAIGSPLGPGHDPAMHVGIGGNTSLSFIMPHGCPRGQTPRPPTPPRHADSPPRCGVASSPLTAPWACPRRRRVGREVHGSNRQARADRVLIVLIRGPASIMRPHDRRDDRVMHESSNRRVCP